MKDIYYLKRNEANMWWVDGACGYCVYGYASKDKVLEEALKRIQIARNEQTSYSWLYSFTNDYVIEEE